MVKAIGIGIQNFDAIIQNNSFYIDKTHFIKEWWESQDSVTLITRPRRFGKTLTMSMVEQFFSNRYPDSTLFEELAIWQEEKYRKLQGTYPVIFLSFAKMKEQKYTSAIARMGQIISALYQEYRFLLEEEVLDEAEKAYFRHVQAGLNPPYLTEEQLVESLNQLSAYLYRYYGKKVIILLDEYDTPMQEAYVYGYWDEMTAFIRNFFNAAFKTNTALEHAILTGITRVSKESVFSDLNHLKVVTTTTRKYETAFGFTEEEVFAALDAYGVSEQKGYVKQWYDGFTFGTIADIYNPWSIINFLDSGEYKSHWANTSSNSLVGKLIRQSGKGIKHKFEDLLRGKSVCSEVDEEIVYSQLEESENAIWSLLLASGYLKVLRVTLPEIGTSLKRPIYELTLTNREVELMFEGMVKDWFGKAGSDYNDFVNALLAGNVKEMNAYMNQVALATFSSFDAGKCPYSRAPEWFYHGFVLGLIVELGDRYLIQSNRESGYGRYDVVLEPKNALDDAMILEFKVYDSEDEQTLQDTLAAALRQIEEKKYAQGLMDRGIVAERIRKYGFVFEGKKVLIG